MTNFLNKLWQLIALGCVLMTPAWAHDPFDGQTDIVVFDQQIEVTVTLGYDAAREFVKLLGLPPEESVRITRRGARTPIALAPGAAALLMQMSASGRPLAPSAFVVTPHDSEIPFGIVFPRPKEDAVQLRAAYFDKIDYMKPGTVMVKNQQSRLIASALLTRDRPQAAIPLQLNAASAAVLGKQGFGQFYWLGVEHILTGFDHLLFLAALLIGVRAVKPMLIVITSFTLAHSLTLALAAFDLVVLPSKIVEPLIAVSIIAVGIENIVRRDAIADRYWMAGLFGLIHGFGFSTILRETALAQGGAIVVPLLGFNLGVESGQLLVAAVVVPLLLLLRSLNAFNRYGPATLSGLVIAVSGAWLMQRVA